MQHNTKTQLLIMECSYSEEETGSPRRAPSAVLGHVGFPQRLAETGKVRDGAPRGGPGGGRAPSHLWLATLGAVGRGRPGPPLRPLLEHRVLELTADHPVPGLHRAPAARHREKAEPRAANACVRPGRGGAARASAGHAGTASLRGPHPTPYLPTPAMWLN
jgi:hypothetical protein